MRVVATVVKYSEYLEIVTITGILIQDRQAANKRMYQSIYSKEIMYA